MPQLLQLCACQADLCGSVFRRLDKAIDSDEFGRKALGLLLHDVKEDFRSTIDALLVVCFPRYRKACFAYYNGAGPQLVELVTRDRRLHMERVMIKALRTAEEQYRIGCEELWSQLQPHEFNVVRKAIVKMAKRRVA